MNANMFTRGYLMSNKHTGNIIKTICYYLYYEHVLERGHGDTTLTQVYL